MSLNFKLLRIVRPVRAICQVRMMSGPDSQQPGLGGGAGKGGGSGGSIREAGGTFGKMEAAHEEQYFRKLAAEQLKALKDHHTEEINFLEGEIKEHQDEISRHKKKLTDLKKMRDAASETE